MRNRWYIMIFLILGCHFAQAQAVNSSCEGSDENRSLFDLDASRLALRHSYLDENIYRFEIELDESSVQLFKNALWAIANTEAFLDVQEVIDFYEIQTHPDPELQSFELYIDTSQIDDASFYNDPIAFLKEESSITVTSDFNTLIDSFDLSMDSMFFKPIPSASIVNEVNLVLSMKSRRLLNLSPLMELWLEHPMFVAAEISPVSNKVITDITSTVATEYIELIYHYNYDCNGEDCLQKHTRRFRVYNDCSVEYMGEHGDPLPTSDLKSIFTLVAFPNPVEDMISFSFLGPPEKDFTVQLHNSIGELMQLEEIRSASGLLQLELSMIRYPVGVYFLSIQNDDQILTEKIIKK